RVVAWRGAVRIQTENNTGQVRIVWRRTAELIIRLPRTGRSDGEVLQLAAPALVADLEIKLAVRAKHDLAPIVIPAHGLAGIRLKRPQRDDVPVHRQGLVGRVPDKTVHAIPEQRRLREVGAVGARAALGPIEIDPVALSKIGLQGDTE